MHVQSLYPPVPETKVQNAHLSLNTPELRASEDFVLHIDGLTGEKRTMKQFWERVYDASTALSLSPSSGGLGIDGGKGDVVGILSHNCLDFLTLVHSLIVLATPIALLPSLSTQFELVHALRTMKPTHVFVHASLLDRALLASKEVGLPQARVHILEGRVPGKKTLADLIANIRQRSAARVAVKDAQENTLAYMVMSSGTTGLPKAVMASHGNINFGIAQAAVAAQNDGLPVDPYAPISVILAFLPFYHTYGLLISAFRGFSPPATSVIIPKWDLEQCLQLIPRYRISFLTLIPSALHQIVNRKGIENVDLSSVKAAMCGAAHTPLQLVERLQALLPLRISYTEGYGQSETTTSVLRQPHPTTLEGRIPGHPDSCGILMPGLEARIIREDGSEADINEAGILLLGGRAVSPGYYGNEKATKETFLEGGWVNTGDTMRMDELQRFFFVDRSKETLKVSGMQVSPTEIEDVLLSQPDHLITDVCVAGVSGYGRTKDEKVPHAWIVLSDEGKKRGEAIVSEQLQQWVQQNLSKFKWLRGGIETVDEIPKSPTGKALRRVLQQKYEERARPAYARL